jgi:hypothetical protein
MFHRTRFSRADLGRNSEAEGLVRGRVCSTYQLLDRSDDFLDRVGARHAPGLGIIRRDQLDRAGNRMAHRRQNIAQDFLGWGVLIGVSMGFIPGRA